jgi:hypothetical protein
MTTEILSRLVAVVVVAGFAWLLADGRLPLIPAGRWTVLAFFVAGLGMCMLAGIRDGIGPGLTQPGWLAVVFTALGMLASVTVLAVLAGASWRLGVVVLGAVIAANWFLAFGYAFATGSDTVLSGAITLLVAVAAWAAIARLSIPLRPIPRAAS